MGDPEPSELRGRVKACQDIVLANLAMIAETPAPTFQEQHRVRFLLDRFREAGLDHISDDEANNATGYLPGPEGAPTVAVVAHLDTLFDDTVSHTLSLGPEHAKGVGLGDNSLGAAVLASLPHLIEACGIELRVNLLLLGVSRSLGRGNLGGLRFWLDHSHTAVDQAICLEGAPLGRLNFSSLAMNRGEIRVILPDEYDYTRFGVNGAIYHLNDIINRMLEIPRPARPRTSIVFGSIDGGNGFHELARKARLRFEVRSESDAVADTIERKIGEIIEEVRARSGVIIEWDAVAHRRSGGLSYGHPLVYLCRKVMRGLGIEPQIGPSMSELAAWIAAGVPAVTLGLSHSHQINTTEEEMEIEPLFDGITQVLGVLAALPSGEEGPS